MSAEEVEAATAVVFEQVDGVEGRVRECVPMKVEATPGAVEELTGEEPGPTAVSLVRACERAVSVVDGWIGEVDEQCVLDTLSGASQAQLDMFLGSVMDPAHDGGVVAKQLETCTK